MSATPSGQGGQHGDDVQRRLVRNPHLRLIRCSDDELLVKHGSRSTYSEIIADERRTHLMGRVVREFAHPTSLSRLYERGLLSGEELNAASELVEYLQARGVLVEPDSPTAVTYADAVLATPGASHRIRSLRVGLIGAGPLGRRVACAFGPFEPASLAILDERPDERVADGGHRLSTAETLAAELAAQGLANACAAAGRSGEDGAVRALCAAADVVLVCWESYSPTLFHSVNEAAVEQAKPWMLAYLDGSEAVLAPAFVPGEGACYLEFEVQSEAAILLKDERLLYKEQLRESPPADPTVGLAAHVDVLGGFASLAALRWLLTGQAVNATRALRIDFERLAIDYQEVLRLPRCPACSPQRTAYRHLFL